jgi:hypothetical protein
MSITYCPKHPHQKMTLLLNNHVCDICNPPNGEKEQTKKPIDITEADLLAEEITPFVLYIWGK